MKEKKTLFTQATFNDAKYAQMVFDEADAKVKRNNIGIICAVVASALNILIVPNVIPKLFHEHTFAALIITWFAIACIAFAVG